MVWSIAANVETFNQHDGSKEEVECQVVDAATGSLEVGRGSRLAVSSPKSLW